MIRNVALPIVVCSILLLPSQTIGRTWLVEVDGNGDAPTIQAGLDSALSGDTVLVGPGTYTGDGNKNLSLSGKFLVLRSELGPTETVIDCEGMGRAATLGSLLPPGVVFQGFTVKNGSANLGGGLEIVASAPLVKECVFVENRSTLGGGATASEESQYSWIVCLLKTLPVHMVEPSPQVLMGPDCA